MLLAALRSRIPRPRPMSAIGGEVAGHPEHRAQDAVVGERHGGAVTGGEDSHADTEGGQDTDQCCG